MDVQLRHGCLGGSDIPGSNGMIDVNGEYGSASCTVGILILLLGL